jgi:hypothetical protein
MVEQKSTNPATGFLIMAGFNVLAALAFVVFYVLYDTSGGERSYYLLIAAGICLFASGGLLVAYTYFRERLQNLMKR